MKKITLFLIIAIILIQFLTNCKKNDPINPAPVDTATISPTWTISPTHTNSFTATNTITVTGTMTPIRTPDGGSSAMVSVPGGTFVQQYDCAGDFNHTISPFKLGKYEVTYELYYAVYNWGIANGYSFQNWGREGGNGVWGQPPSEKKYNPVLWVNWRDTIVWCNAYSQKSGLTPVYYSDAGLTTPLKDSTDGAYASSINTAAGSFDNPYVSWTANGYRLPTLGEWQYAASYINGSSVTPCDFASGATGNYQDTAATALVAWFYPLSGNSTKDVGLLTPNALGIYDMSGNAYERCWDWDGTLPTGPVTDYRGPATGTERILCGGDFNNYLPMGDMFKLIVSDFDETAPYNVYSNYGGFRVAQSN